MRPEQKTKSRTKLYNAIAGAKQISLVVTDGAAVNEGDEPGHALQESVEWVAPVWVAAGDVDWAWVAEMLADGC